MRRALERFSTEVLKPVVDDARKTPEFVAKCIGVAWPHRSYSSDAENSCILEHPKTGREMHLLGCIHGSEDSASEIRSRILDISPSTVVLPICDNRYNSILNGTAMFPEEIYNLIRSQSSNIPAPMPINADQLTDLVKSWFRWIGFEPGIALQTAVQTAQHKSAEVVCGEPPAHTLLQEAQAAMMAIPDTRATLTRRMQEHIFSKDTPMTEFLAAAEEEGLPLSTGGLEFAMALESIRTRRTARGVVTVMRVMLPEAVAALVDRRDDEMTRRLLEAAGGSGSGPVVGVAGLMHLDGIERRCIESHLDSMYAQKYIG